MISITKYNVERNSKKRMGMTYPIDFITRKNLSHDLSMKSVIRFKMSNR